MTVGKQETTTSQDPAPRWDEQTSQAFIDYGRYFVPDRERQIEIIGELIPLHPVPFHIVELCCGEGLLAQALLERFPAAILHGFDGSAEMLGQAQARLAPYGGRFSLHSFDLAAAGWRQPGWPVSAVVSSLAIHHLDGDQKQALYRDIYRLLEGEGVLVIADLVQPAHPLGVALAARQWDETVRERALALDGDTHTYDLFQQTEWNMYLYPDPMDKPSRLLDQLKWLEAAGFMDVDVYWLKAGHAIFGGRKGAS